MPHARECGDPKWRKLPSRHVVQKPYREYSASISPSSRLYYANGLDVCAIITGLFKMLAGS